MQLEAQVVPTIIHYHHGWLIWILFLVGGVLHAALQIDSISRAHKMSRGAVLSAVGIPLLYRTFACSMVFGLIWQHPDLISKIAGIFGHPLGSDEQSVFAIPMNNSIAGLYGLFLDSLLGYIPILKSQLPPIDPPAGFTATTTTITESKIEPTPKRTIAPWPEMADVPVVKPPKP